MSDSYEAGAVRVRDSDFDPGFEITGVTAGYYGQSVVFDVSVRAAAGQVTALFGHNGAGKSTLLRAAVGLVGRSAGCVYSRGVDLSSYDPRDMFKAGVVYLPQDHATFPGMTVRENLDIGAIGCGRLDKRRRLDHVVAIFPILEERINSKAKTLSGGQQRMLSIAMALMADAKVLLLDEPSLGLAPALTQSLMLDIQKLAHNECRTVILVEQAIGQALPIVDSVYVMRTGTIIAHMDRPEALSRPDWSDVY